MTLFTIPVSSQSTYDDSSRIIGDSLDLVEISLLTCQPHDEVYSLYGHTAIRVQDPKNGLDVAVNWGIFDSRKPNFVLRFVFGLTDYMMGIVPIELFVMEYSSYGSGVYQQRLALTPIEKKRVIDALRYNYLPENREYRYNFYYDNCTSRARDIILASIDGNVSFHKTEMQKGERSFRDLIHWKNHDHHWAAFGNDLLLGLESDKNTTSEQRQFLPEVLMADFDSATVVRWSSANIPNALVDSAFWLVKPGQQVVEGQEFPATPIVCALFLLCALLIFTLLEKRFFGKHTIILDNIMLFLYGVCGMILFAMLFSEHPTVKVNLQIFLFSPLWIVFALQWRKWQKARCYVILVSLMVFFVGNLFQSYAEGMNILALTLLVRVISHFLFLRETQNEQKAFRS